MENKKRYKLQVDVGIEINEGDTKYLVHDNDQSQAAEELINFLYENEEIIKKHVLVILAEELNYYTEEDKESYYFDILHIIKNGISDIAWEKLNLKIGGVSSHLYEELDRMIDVTANIQSKSFKRND